MFLDPLLVESNTEGRYKPMPRRIGLHKLVNHNAGSWSKQGPFILLTMFTTPFFNHYIHVKFKLELTGIMKK